MKLTQKEKADRYDSLQTAIKWTIRLYKERIAEMRISEKGEGTKLIGFYNSGYISGVNIEEKIARPVWTHELANEDVQKLIREKTRDDFVKLCQGEDE